MNAEELASVTLEHLRHIRADLADVKDRLLGVEVQLSAMGQQLAGLTTAVYSGKSEMDSVRRRLERIERRLDLADPPH
jgi:predicted  nucleic acid-binding Zn-ribbon protein